jgi:uncharacterized protein (DUF2147 family)
MRAIALAAALTLAAAPAFAADAAEGEWFNQTGSAKIRIAPCAGQAGKLCGTISWLRPPNEKAKDANNPDPQLKTRPLQGMQMLWGFKSSGPGKWTGGKIYDPNSGKTYDSKVSVNANGTLKIEGCILMVCQGQTWRRA